MTLYDQTTNSIGPGIQFLLPAGSDTFIEAAGASVIATGALAGDDAIASIAAGALLTMEINDQIIGANAIEVTSASSTLDLANESTSLLDGDGGYGLQAFGFSNVSNFGQIVGTSGDVKLGSGKFCNYGEASCQTGTNAGIFASGQTSIYNYGTINATDAVYFGSGSAAKFSL